LTATLFTILGVMTLVLLAWSLRQLVRPDPVQRAWSAFCRKLAARGVERVPHEGPRDYSVRAARALPGSRRAILRIAWLYIGLRYGSQESGRGSSAAPPGAPAAAHVKRFCAVFLALISPALAQQPGYAERPEVRAFIRELVERHGFIERELLAMFARVQR